MTGGDGFYDETEVGPTLADLDKQRSIPKSKYHNPQYVKEEEEILEFYKGWIHCLNNEFNKSIDPGRKFYNFDDCMTYVIYGYTGRGVFKPHYDNTFHYFSDYHCGMKDLEIFATSPATGYALLVQRLKGKTDRGEPFQMTYRMTQIVQKVEGKWQWIHEHVSFPCDMRTMRADSTCSVDPLEAFQFKELENGSKK